MICIQLLNKGKVIKQITSRVHESVMLEQVKQFKDAFDTVQIVEGELSEDAKSVLQHVARKIIPAAMAAGVAIGGTNVQAQGGANPNYPGMDRSIGQHISDIVSPRYNEIQRQRKYEQETQRKEWDAQQDELRQGRVDAARTAGRTSRGITNYKLYDQSRISKDGKHFLIYGMDDKITRIPTAGTEFMAADSQRLAHYISPGGQVYYVRHPHNNGLGESVLDEAVGTIGTVGTIPASGASAVTQKTQFSKTGGTTDVKFNSKGQLELDDEIDPEAIDTLKKAGVEVAEATGVSPELSAILDQYSDAYDEFKAGGDLTDNITFYEALVNFFSDSKEMPYDVATSGDPAEWISDKLNQLDGHQPMGEADDMEATPGDQAAADQNIIMQIRKASDYKRPARIKLADGTESIIAPNIAKQLLAKFEKMKPESKALLQNTLNTEEGFKEILAYFGGGVREQAAARAGKIMQSAMVEAGVLDDVRARMDARRDPPEKQSANPTTPLPPVPPYVAPEAPTELKAGDIIGYRVPGSKMMPIKAKVLKLLSGDRAMVSVSSPTLIAQNNGSPVITIGPLDSLEIQNPFKAIAKNESVVNEAAEDWLPAYNALVKGNGEPRRGSGLLWQKVLALAAKDNGITGGQELANFVLQYAQNRQTFKTSTAGREEWNQLTNEITSLMRLAPTMDQMRDAVKQQAANQHQQNLTAIQQQLDLENAPLQHELSVQALINKAELDQADQKELLELDMEARLAIIKIKQDLELDAKERLIAIEREIEDRKEREDVRKHELEMAQAGYKHELAVINATAEGEYKKAKLEADYQIQIKQLDNIDNAGERQNRLDQINTEKAKQIAVIDAETKARVEVMQKEVDVEKQQNDARIEQAFMMTLNPIWGAALTAAHAAGSTWKAGINNLNKALAMLSKPVMPKPQKESRYDRRDAYQRDYDNSISGMGKKDSYAYQQDGGANDEDHAGDARREQQTQSGTWYILKDGKIVKDKAGQPFTFRGKAAANKAAVTMMQKPFNQGKKFMLTTNPNNNPQGVAEDEEHRPVANANTSQEFNIPKRFQAKTGMNIGIKEADMNSGNQGYDSMLAVMKAVDAGHDATFNLGGEPITLDYNEARFLAGKYKAFLKAGRQEEFLKYMESPVAFDRLMKQLRDLMDKQRNFRGSVQGDRGLDEGVIDAVKAGVKKVVKAVTGPDDEELLQRLEKETGGKRPEKKDSLPAVKESEYWCKIDRTAKLIPEGYKKLSSGYITRTQG